MTTEDHFEPELGRIRAGAKSGKSLRHVMRRVARAGGGRPVGTKRRFDGSRIGRGAGVAAVLRSRDRYAGFRARRVVIQTRIIRLKRVGVNAARLHLRYLQRDGVSRDGERGQLYDARQDRADGRNFLERGEGDRHQFRFIVSPEDGTAYDDLKPFVRRLFHEMDEDLGTKLDWVAVDHHNTGHPHSHVVLRGKDENGRDLVIARDYITHGMRARASAILTLDLGPRSDREIENRLRQEVDKERFTSLDRALQRAVDAEGFIHVGDDANDVFRQSLQAGRLRKLENLDLAHEVAPGTWQLQADFEPTLRRLGERGDIIKTIHREMAEAKLDRGAFNYAIYDSGSGVPLIGRVIAHGLADELEDRRYLIVDGIDARTHYVGMGTSAGNDMPAPGAVVHVRPNPVEARTVDRTVADIAAEHGGRYSPALHRQHDPSASEEFIRSHVRRLEAMRRRAGTVTRETDGTWTIAPDHVARATDYERAQPRIQPITLQTLSRMPLDHLAIAEGATWLDRELVSDTPLAVRDGGFGHDVREALRRRRQWLIEQDLAKVDRDQIVYRAGLLRELRRREVAGAGRRLAAELGKPFAEAESGNRIEGTYRRAVELVSGRHALIERARDFTLVPWRPVLETNLGKSVSGLVRGEAISWTIGRQRSGPTIT